MDSDTNRIDQQRSPALLPAPAQPFLLPHHPSIWGNGECCDATLGRSIQYNNIATQFFLEGRLMEAQLLFMESSQLQLQSLNDERHGAQEYRCKWVSVDLGSSLARNSNITNLSPDQQRLVSRIFLRLLIIDGGNGSAFDDIAKVRQDHPEPADEAPDVSIPRLEWAVNYNLALNSQILGLLAPDSPAMFHRAASFELYEKVSLDIVDWFNEDGYAPLSIAVLLMAIYNNQGAMHCQLAVRHNIETYWGHLRRIWKGSCHKIKGKHYSRTFEDNLRWLDATNSRAAGAA